MRVRGEKLNMERMKIFGAVTLGVLILATTMIYSDCFLLTDQIAECGLLNQQQLIKLKALDDALEQMSSKGDKELWTCEALKANLERQSIRLSASEHLILFGKAKTAPRFVLVSL